MRTKSFPYSIPTRSLENAAIVSISNVALVQFVVVLNQFKLLARFFVVFVCLFLFTVIKRPRPPALSSFPDSFQLVSLVKVLRVLVFFLKKKTKCITVRPFFSNRSRSASTHSVFAVPLARLVLHSNVRMCELELELQRREGGGRDCSKWPPL